MFRKLKEISALTLISMFSQSISIIFSVEFYLNINIFFAIVVVLFEISIFVFSKELNKLLGTMKIIFSLLVISFSLFSILGVVANINNLMLANINEQYKTVNNYKYDLYLAELKLAKDNVELHKKQLEQYPSLADYTKNSPKWEDKTELTKTYEEAKNKISNDFVEEVLKSSSYFYGWYFRRQRNDFYVLSTDLMTLVYDLSYGVWYRWISSGQDNWKVSTGIQKDNILYGANLLQDSQLYKLLDGVKDEDEDWLVCEVTGVVMHNERIPLACNMIEIIANTGFSSSYGSEPIVELRWSDDQGANWSSYSQVTLGDRGQTTKSVLFRSLGLIKTPGRRFEIRFSGADVFRLDYVIMNGGV